MIEPVKMSYEAFPSSDASEEGMKELKAESGSTFCSIHLNVEYAVKSGQSLHLEIIEPPVCGKSRFPLIVYIQGSAWFKQDLGDKLFRLGDFARRGFVVAIAEYRPSTAAPFPAQICDAKTAVRFMRAHAGEYHVDEAKVAVWGDSSGGHTALMTAVTMQNQAFDDEDAKAASLEIGAVVDYYGPTDISLMNEAPSTQDHTRADSPEGMLIGGVSVPDHPELAGPTRPAGYLDGENVIPPILMVHGSKDRLVPFEQSVLFYRALRKAGREVEFYKLTGADHGGAAFWQENVLDLVEAFLRRHL